MNKPKLLDREEQKEERKKLLSYREKIQELEFRNALLSLIVNKLSHLIIMEYGELKNKYKNLYQISDQILMDVSNQWEDGMGTEELDQILEDLRKFMLEQEMSDEQRDI